ncbi:MAG: hypothetical protein MUF45_13640 [Spirosomaceae bacterium]|jgi:hypothetical protein|nr:hypothetical protein [Spirosomataceae bacterium]
MTEEQAYKILSVFAYLLILSRGILLLTTLNVFRQSRAIKALFWYALIAFIIAIGEMTFIYLVKNYTEYFMPFLKRFEISNTFFISPLYYINELVFISLFFYQILKDKYPQIFLIGCLLAILEIINTLFFEGYKEAQFWGSLVYILNNIILSILYIYNFNTQKLNQIPTKHSYYLIALAILIFYLLSLFIYLLTKFIFDDFTIIYYQLSIFRMSVQFLGYLVMSFAILKYSNRLT